MLCLPALQAYALKASSDSLGGYSAQVLQKVLDNYVQPVEAKGSTLVLVRIGADGRPYSCEVIKKSSSTQVDDALCVTVARVGQFEELQGLGNIEVALNFVYEDMTRNNMNARQVLANPQVQHNSTPFYPAVSDNNSQKSQAKQEINQKQAKEQNIGAGIVQRRLDASNEPVSSVNTATKNANTVAKKKTERFTLQDAVTEIEKKNALANSADSQENITQEKFPPIEDLSFAEELLNNVKPYLETLPHYLPNASYKVKFRIKTNSNGQLTGLDILESSQSEDYDIFVQDIILVKDVIPFPKDGKNQEAIITFVGKK